MRLNWFMPWRPKGKRGAAGRVLGAIGPTWLASPLRRVIQAACLGCFLVLFFYVTWPYTAEPARCWYNWLPIEVDAQSGRIDLVSEDSHDTLPSQSEIVHVSDSTASVDPYLGRFSVSSVGDGELSLEPVEPLDAETLDKLAVSFGPWSLSQTDPANGPSHYADDLSAKQRLPSESFLIIDPLVSISTAIAARSWVWSLWAAGALLLACLLVPRGFCGYVCPLGALIDLFDWVVGKRVSRFRAWFKKGSGTVAGTARRVLRTTVPDPFLNHARFRVAADGRWVHLKYYLLVASLAAAAFGVLLTGFVAAIPVATRGLNFLLTPLQMGTFRGWHQVPSLGVGHAVSILLFLSIFALGLLRPRFWCRYVCPTGAIFSVANLLRLTDRKVESSCVGCGSCVEICPFDAINPDFTTRGADCTFCQTCGGVCPVDAIKFVGRANAENLVEPSADRSVETPNALRRSLLFSPVGVLKGVVGGEIAALAVKTLSDGPGGLDAKPVVRPPGSVPEREFLAMCIRCAACYQACPNNVLQPLGFARGLGWLWTPQVTANWSGCEPSCNNCGQVCPTGAIRAIPLDEKRVARLGLAVVDRNACLPYVGKEECRLCVDECSAAGYNAIEFVHVGTETDAQGEPIEGTGMLAPVVLAEKCVGCGLCQTRCYAINSKEKALLHESAVIVEAGAGKEDRLMEGSYISLRKREEQARRKEQQELLKDQGGGESYLPDFLQ